MCSKGGITQLSPQALNHNIIYNLQNPKNSKYSIIENKTPTIPNSDKVELDILIGQSLPSKIRPFLSLQGHHQMAEGIIPQTPKTQLFFHSFSPQSHRHIFDR